MRFYRITEYVITLYTEKNACSDLNYNANYYDEIRWTHYYLCLYNIGLLSNADCAHLGKQERQHLIRVTGNLMQINEVVQFHSPRTPF